MGHDRDDQRLRDGLAMPDRQRAVVIGPRRQIRRHELLARHLGQRLQHPWIEPTLAVAGAEQGDLPFEHVEQRLTRGRGLRPPTRHPHPGSRVPTSCRK